MPRIPCRAPRTTRRGKSCGVDGVFSYSIRAVNNYVFIYLFDCVVNIRSILVSRNGIKNSQKHPLCQCYLTETGSKQGHEEATEALTRTPILTKEKYKMIYCVKNKA